LLASYILLSAIDPLQHVCTIQEQEDK
jgi:hypothetical protein